MSKYQIFLTKMIRPFFLIVLICVLSAQYECKVTGKVVTKKLGKILSGFGNVQSAFDIASIVIDLVLDIPPTEEEILKHVKELGPELHQVLIVSVQTFENSKTILKLMESSTDRQLLADKMDAISRSMSEIETEFYRSLDHQMSAKKAKKVIPAVSTYANSILQPSTSKVSKIMGDIQTHIKASPSTSNTGILELTLSLSQDFAKMCNKKKSMNMIIYDIYKSIKNTQVTAYTIASIAYEILKTSNRSEELELTKDLLDRDMVRQENIINAAFKDALQRSSRAIWTCDKKINSDEYVTWESLHYPREGKRIYINVDTVYSDIQKNMVVTGARFNGRYVSREESEIFIEIQQGKLLDNGTIDATTLQWKDKSSVAKPNRVLFESKSSEFAFWARDFHNMFDGKNPIVLTGLGLKEIIPGRFIVQSSGSPIVLPTTGPIQIGNKFIEADSFVLPQTPDNGRYTRVPTLEMQRKSLSINELHSTTSSIDAPGPDNIIRRSTAWVRFQKLKNKDVLGPFLDLTEVVTNPPMPMSGAGLYYKTSKDYAGYAGIELYTLSLETNVPNEVLISTKN